MAHGQSDVLVGVDVGTSVVKATAFAPSGDVLAVASEPVALSRPRPGWVEQDAGEVVRQVASVLGDVLAQVPRPPGLVALTGQGDGCWLLDADGAPVRPAVSWLDARAAGIVDDWGRSGLAQELYARTGTAVFPGLQAPVLAWLDRHERASLDRAATAAYCKDVVLQALTGERATDPSDASAIFGPTPASGAGGYDSHLLDACGLGHRAGLLAPVHAPVPLGRVVDRAASPSGLPLGTAVTAGPYDLAACAAGAGVTGPGDGLVILGTTLACLVPTRRDAGEVASGGEAAGLLLRLPQPGLWLRAMPAMVGTAGLDWVLALTGLRHDQLDAVLTATSPGGGVRALPFLSPSGERAPFVDTAARGQLTGLTLETTGADLVRAVCEALAYAARRCLEAAGATGRVVACGGGTRSRPWLRILASVLGRPVEVAPGPHVGARGAVLTGLAHPGVVGPDGGSGWALTSDVVEPDPAAVPVHAEGYETYLRDEASARRSWHPGR